MIRIPAYLYLTEIWEYMHRDTMANWTHTLNSALLNDNYNIKSILKGTILKKGEWEI